MFARQEIPSVQDAAQSVDSLAADTLSQRADSTSSFVDAGREVGTAIDALATGDIDTFSSQMPAV
ncbi:MAG: hypothetical protein OXT73_02905, partial [Bacteroidota bacterium]|nr:hypothetical protein [Bacteroidota bacterium]